MFSCVVEFLENAVAFFFISFFFLTFCRMVDNWNIQKLTESFFPVKLFLIKFKEKPLKMAPK